MKTVVAPMEVMLTKIRIDVNNLIRYSADVINPSKKATQMVMRRCHVIELARKAQRIENERKRTEKKNGCTLESRKEQRNVLNYYRNSR